MGEAIKILAGKEDKCKTVYLRRQLNLENFTVKMFEERILKGALNMVAPDCEIDGSHAVLIPSDEEDRMEGNNDKVLKDFGLVDGSVLTCDDYLQNYTLKVYLWHADKLEDGTDFLVTGDKEQLKPKEEEEPEEEKKETNGSNKDEAINLDDEIVEVVSASNGAGDKKRPADEGQENGAAKKPRIEGDSDEVVICEEKSAEDLKKSLKAAAEPEDGVVCIE